MQEALAIKDWSSIAVLDPQCRLLVSEAVEDAGVDLRQQLAELYQLYQVMQQAVRSERHRIMSELTQLNKSKQVDQTYNTYGC
ncbi:flagellar protein FliT [Stutzerimonas stutzeri]|uniref:flagellar protein FliT n=1 Tax=Stutzerimonas stutzeri TaxID=316 RepID=UPI001F508609|nr:flagellar protein FliT [Stutzerimonas stutzeri]WRQ04738.1 flagellar protein FliT [Stutzerimonas stutzeri]